MRKSLVADSLLIAINLVLGLALTRVAIGQDETTDDAKAVQGTWTPVKAELAGTAWPDAVLKTIVLKMDADKYEVSVAGKLDKGTYKQDPTARPKRRNPGHGRPERGQVISVHLRA